MQGIYPLIGVVKHYDWGGTAFIPHLLRAENRDNKPFAEYWMGVHPLGTAMVRINGSELEISSLTGPLSFLIKVLDVNDMLSIQVHPSKEAAEKEFAREQAAGIPLDAPHRNYKDANHKPELMVALGDFWLLHGFKPPEELVYTLLNIVELRELLPIYNQAGYSGLYKHIMEMPQQDVNRILGPLIENISTIYKDKEADRYDEDFWAARAARTFNSNGNIDRGIFSIYLFNLVHLKKGEGIFQAPGVPHAYLEGQNVEIMANSDNVLRGGLTTKHIDVPELLKHVKAEATYPEIISGEKVDEHLLYYQTPVSDFRLEKIELAENNSIKLKSTTAEILIETDGALRFDGTDLTLQSGQPAALVMPGTEYMLTGINANSTVFRAYSGFKQTGTGN